MGCAPSPFIEAGAMAILFQRTGWWEFGPPRSRLRLRGYFSILRLRLRGCERGEGEEQLFHALAFEGDGDLLVAGDDFAADDDA